jgi:hypothetical protein
MSGGVDVTGCEAGDLLIERVPSGFSVLRPDGPRVAVAMQKADRGETGPITVLLGGLITEVNPALWGVAPACPG